MKVITFLRHSKSSWDYDVSDIHRPLSPVGIEKIKKTANSSKDQFISSEIIFTSCANRALYTSILLAKSLSINFNKIKICDELYTFNFIEVMEFIKSIDNIYSNEITDIAIGYLKPLLNQEIESLILGCSHYPLITPLLMDLLPSNVKLIDPAEALSLQL